MDRRTFFKLAGAAAVVAATPSAFLRAAETDPMAGWLLADGSSLERKKYAELFSYIGEMYGADNEATFRLPPWQSDLKLPAGVIPLRHFIKVRPTPDNFPVGAIVAIAA